MQRRNAPKKVKVEQAPKRVRKTVPTPTLLRVFELLVDEGTCRKFDPRSDSVKFHLRSQERPEFELDCAPGINKGKLTMRFVNLGGLVAKPSVTLQHLKSPITLTSEPHTTSVNHQAYASVLASPRENIQLRFESQVEAGPYELAIVFGVEITNPARKAHLGIDFLWVDGRSEEAEEPFASGTLNSHQLSPGAVLEEKRGKNFAIFVGNELESESHHAPPLSHLHPWSAMWPEARPFPEVYKHLTNQSSGKQVRRCYLTGYELRTPEPLDLDKSVADTANLLPALRELCARRSIRGLSLFSLIDYLSSSSGTRLTVAVVGAAVRDLLRGIPQAQISGIELVVQSCDYQELGRRVEHFFSSRGQPLNEATFVRSGKLKQSGRMKIRENEATNDEGLEIGLCRAGYRLGEFAKPDPVERYLYGSSWAYDAMTRNYSVNAVYVDVCRGKVYDPCRALIEAHKTEGANVNQSIVATTVALERLLPEPLVRELIWTDAGKLFRLYSEVGKSTDNLSIVAEPQTSLLVQMGLAKLDYNERHVRKLWKTLFRSCPLASLAETIRHQARKHRDIESLFVRFGTQWQDQEKLQPGDRPPIFLDPSKPQDLCIELMLTQFAARSWTLS